uniref:Uncharacterized protein n=1 Tax=Oryza meridionalis TaxID=40149 RepID=A0A0E0E9U5_9ORYZ
MAGGGGEEGAGGVEGGELGGREREPGGGAVARGRREAARRGGLAARGWEAAQRGGIGAAPGGGGRGGSGARGEGSCRVGGGASGGGGRSRSRATEGQRACTTRSLRCSGSGVSLTDAAFDLRRARAMAERRLRGGGRGGWWRRRKSSNWGLPSSATVEAPADSVESAETVRRGDSVESVETHTPQFLGLSAPPPPPQGKRWSSSSHGGSGAGSGVIVSVFPDHPSFSDAGMPPPPAKWKGCCEPATSMAPWMLTVAASTMDRSIRTTVRLGNSLYFDGESLYQPNDSPNTFYPLVYAGASGKPFTEFCGNGSLDGFDVRGKIG